MSNTTALRPARIDDAAVLAELVNYAGEGLPLYLWGKLASAGETAWDVGRQRAARDTGSFSWRNATIIEHAETAAGSLIGYAIPGGLEPVPSDTLAMFVPLQELENLAPGTWYVNVLAVLPPYRGLGLGSELLRFALARSNPTKTWLCLPMARPPCVEDRPGTPRATLATRIEGESPQGRGRT
jgi:ribosomal protein S18 acetylase RimI-like enzyme